MCDVAGVPLGWKKVVCGDGTMASSFFTSTLGGSCDSGSS